MLLNVLQVYSTVPRLQNDEGIARKVGSGKFPYLSHVSIKAFIAQNKYSSSNKIAAGSATQQPCGEVIAARTVCHYLSKEMNYSLKKIPP